MDWDDLSPEQQQHFKAAETEFVQQLARVGVDLPAASPHMHKIQRPRRRELAGDENSDSYIIELIVDYSGILDTLRRLPDGAGTSAFVVAYNADHSDWRDRASNER